MYANKNEFPDWLLGIGLRVEDWSFRYPQAARYIRKQIAIYYYEHRQRDEPGKMTRCPDGEWKLYSKPNPVLLIPEQDGRRLTLAEEYFACAVIHDVTCPYAKPMKTWRSRKYRGKSQKLWVHASDGISTAYYIAKKYVSDLKDEDCYEVFHGFRNVEADLKKLNLIPHEPSITTVFFPDIRPTSIPAPEPQPVTRFVKLAENPRESEPTMEEWLKNFAVTVDELFQAGDFVYQKFREMILLCDEAAKLESPERHGLVGGLPTRALTLPEKYTWLAAIRDTYCKDVVLVDPYKERAQTDDMALVEGRFYGIRRSEVRRLTIEDKLRLEKVLADVEDDFGVKPQQMLPPVKDESNQPTTTHDYRSSPSSRETNLPNYWNNHITTKIHLFDLLKKLLPHQIAAELDWQNAIWERSKDVAKRAKKKQTKVRKQLVAQAHAGEILPVSQLNRDGEWIKRLDEIDEQAYQFYHHGGDPESAACLALAETELKKERVPEWQKMDGSIAWQEDMPYCRRGTPWGFVVDKLIDRAMPFEEEELIEATRLLILGQSDAVPIDIRKFAREQDESGYTEVLLKEIWILFPEDAKTIGLDKLDESASPPLRAENDDGHHHEKSVDSNYLFQCSGDTCTINFDGESHTFKQSKGLDYLYHLVKRSVDGVEGPIHVSMLMMIVNTTAVPANTLKVGDAIDGGDSGDISRPQEIIDPQARDAYMDLRCEMDKDPDWKNNPEIVEQHEKVMSMVKGTYFQGSAKTFQTDTNRHQDAVRNAINRAICKLDGAKMSIAAQHFKQWVKKGEYLQYYPTPLPDWIIQKK